MLDKTKKYYVSAEMYPADVIARWASRNEMKLEEKVKLPVRGEAYRLDVGYNRGLAVEISQLGAGKPNFMNGRKIIGKVVYDNVIGEAVVVVSPAIFGEMTFVQ